MKYILSTFLVLLLCFLPLSANSQKYYSVSSTEWQRVNELCHYAGVVGPASNGPITRGQLQLALDRAESSLSSDNPLLIEIRNLLKDENNIINDDISGFSFKATLTPEAYIQSNKGEKAVYDLDEDWFVKNQRERRAATIKIEGNIRNYLYSRFVLDYKQNISNYSNYSYWNDNFHLSFCGFDMLKNVPLDCGFSLGTKEANLIIGRGKVSLGEGYTGNTAIGDNYDYQEFLKAGFYTKNISVFVTLTSFDSSHKVGLKPYEVLSARFSDYQELRHAASYEVVIGEKVKTSLTFISLLDTNNSFDFRYLNPFMVMHNYFNYHEETILEANNMITLDLSCSFAPKWNIYSQITMDQFQVKGEAEGYTGFGYTEPNAFGGLINLSYTDIVNKTDILSLYGELVYNMPGMYLNTKYYLPRTCKDVTYYNGEVTQYNHDRSNPSVKYTERCFSQDYLLGYKRTESNYDDTAYSGYIYGPDCFVSTIGMSWRKPSVFSLSSSVMYMAHGEKGRGEDEANYTFDGIGSLSDVNRIALTGTVEHTLVIKAEAEVQLLSYLSFTLGGAYQYRWNYRNKADLSFSNLQLYIGLKLASFDFSV